MALNPLKISWLEYLYTKNVFKGKKTILDLGPQDLTTNKDYLYNTVSHRFNKKELTSILNKIYDENGKPSQDFQKYFYSIWGLQDYYSLDFNDLRADYVADLNKVVNLNKQFDVITNFGTAEHIFNIGIFYENLHNLLNTKGIALSINPTYGDINHGFYNIHPNVYSQLIKTNEYIQHSFVYLDNYVGKNGLLSKTLKQYNFDDPRINLGNRENNFADMSELKLFRAKVYSVFKENITNSSLLKYVGDTSRGCFDYTFVAFEKTIESQFKIPQQYTRNVELLPN